MADILRRFRSASARSFALIVLLPTLVAAIYYGLLASDVYVSESRIVLRAPEEATPTGFGALLQSAGFSNASEEVYAVAEYMGSRDAVQDANRDGYVRNAYSQSEVFVLDRFNGHGFDGSFEALYRYFTDKISIKTDTQSSIVTLTTRAFSAKDAQLLNEKILRQSEQLVNRLNTRGRQDLIGVAREELIEAENQARTASERLAEFRNQTGVVDPTVQAQLQLELVTDLRQELLSAQLELEQLQRVAPANPQVSLLRQRVSRIDDAIDTELGKISGNSRSLAANTVDFQRLQIDNEISEKRVAAATNSLLEAQNEARRQQIYVERIADPNLPDVAIEPRRWAGILAVFALSLITWGIAAMLLAGVREHAG